MMRVFVSSTSRDLSDHRAAVLAAIDGLDGFTPIAMENFGARAASAVDFDERLVRQSDVLVGLLGLCYGSSPQDMPPSFTEREHDCAEEAGIDRLMLVSPEDFPVAGHLIEPDAQRELQKAFRARVKTAQIVGAFDSPATLARAVTQALANWRAEQQQVDRITAELRAAQEAAARHEARANTLEAERDALRAAVHALAAKAHEPDAPPEIAQALALLPEGRTAEAEAIFGEIVARKAAEGRRKTTEAAADLQEAAEAARNLGALAYLADTARALQAYQTATELDPDDTWSWIYLGRLHQQAGDLSAAEEAFASAHAAAEGAGDQRDVMVADASLGDVRVAKGDLGGALAAYERARATAQTLAAQDQGSADWQRDLSVTFNRIGDLQTARGDLDGALEAYRDSFAIREKLAAQDPGNAGRQRDLSVSFERIGDAQTARGHLDGALQAYRDSLAIAERLAAQDQRNAGRQRDLSVSFTKIGDVQEARGDLDGALEAYRDSFAIREKLAAQDQGNAEWQRDLSISYERIGDVQRARCDLDGALESYRAELAIAERLAGAGPDNATWQADHARSHERVGDIAVLNDDASEAASAFEQSLTIYHSLLGRYPDNTQILTFSVVPHWRLGTLKGADGRPHLERALAILRELDREDRLDATRKTWIAEIEAEIATDQP